MTPRRLLPLPAVAFAALLGVAACGGDDAASSSTTAGAGTATTAGATTTSKPPLVTDTSTTEAETTTTAEATTTTAEGDVGDDGPAIPTNAEDYATAFVDAWATGDHDTALVLGTQEAVDTIFAFESGGEEGSTATWTLQSCDGAAGSVYCTFSAGGDPEVVVRVANEAAQQGQQHAVTEVQVNT